MAYWNKSRVGSGLQIDRKAGSGLLTEIDVQQSNVIPEVRQA